MTERGAGWKFAVFALVCALGAAWLVQVTGNYRFFARTRPYEAVLADATGLQAGDSVHLAGVRVGRVQDIDIERGRVVVSFNLDRELTPTDTWETGVRWRNVIGQRYLYLYAVGDGRPLAPGSRIPVERSRPDADLGLLFERLTPLLRAIDPEQQNILLGALNEALDGRAERVRRLVDDLGSLTGTLAGREAQIRTVVDEGAALLGAYARRDAEIRAFIDDLADTSATLAARNDELVGAVADIAEVQRQLGALLEANDAEIRSLAGHLERITATIGQHHDALDAALGSAAEGQAVYMTISRWGQWFNVRAVAVQIQDDGEVLLCRAESGAACADPTSGEHGRPGGQAEAAAERRDALAEVSHRALLGSGRLAAAGEGRR